MIGKTISHYRILEKLGAGGMGTVYKAQDTKLDRFVALKFLPPHLSQDEENKKRFVHEAKAASALDHPNICTIHEIGETEDGQLFIAMACYEGESLKDKIEGGPMPINEAMDIAVQVALGLSRAHEDDIIHRDIKPANIMITNRDEVKLVDFGLAKLAGRTVLTKEGTTLGTVAYMSPEQAHGAEVDRRSDIWALGALIYEMISGRQPFAGDYEQAVMYAIMNEEPDPLTGLRTGVPMDLERLVNKCLNKNPDERYQGIDELLVDLKALKKMPTSADNSTQRGTTQRGTKRRTPLYAGLISFLVLLVVGGWYFWKGSDPEKIDSSAAAVQRLAVLPFTNVRDDPEIEFLGFALADQIIGGLIYIKDILVRPSSAVRKYQDRHIDAPTAGEELNVDYVLTGNYQKEGELVRLNIELVNARSNTMLWREPIEATYENAFRLQDMVAEKVLAGLKVQFSQKERDRIQTDIPQNPLAYEYYLRSIAYPLSVEGNKLAIELLKKSIQLDSTYAPAFAVLGRRTNQIAQYEMGSTGKVHQAKKAYLKAISLNDELPSALSNLAMLHAETGQIGDAVELLRRLLKINPNYAEAHFSLSYAYRYGGMLEESATEGERALSLDPDNRLFRSVAVTYGYLGKLENALQSLKIDPGSPWTISFLGETYFRMGQTDRAIEHFDRAIELEPDGVIGLWSLALKSSKLGDPYEGLRALRKWEQTNIVDGEQLYHLANTYGLLGDKTACIQALEKAVEAGFFNYPFMQSDYFLDSVRDEPEFQRVLAMAKTKHEAFKGRYFP